ncbi:hypothetical protein KM043_013072 [Ampulex compressa]|nr:hypothetical protein KM043_013072 [Ampulex compressa]
MKRNGNTSSYEMNDNIPLRTLQQQPLMLLINGTPIRCPQEWANLSDHDFKMVKNIIQFVDDNNMQMCAFTVVNGSTYIYRSPSTIIKVILQRRSANSDR